jgi:hypothetical protein
MTLPWSSLLCPQAAGPLAGLETLLSKDGAEHLPPMIKLPLEKMMSDLQALERTAKSVVSAGGGSMSVDIKELNSWLSLLRKQSALATSTLANIARAG